MIVKTGGFGDDCRTTAQVGVAVGKPVASIRIVICIVAVYLVRNAVVVCFTRSLACIQPRIFISFSRLPQANVGLRRDTLSGSNIQKPREWKVGAVAEDDDFNEVENTVRRDIWQVQRYKLAGCYARCNVQVVVRRARVLKTLCARRVVWIEGAVMHPNLMVSKARLEIRSVVNFDVLSSTRFPKVECNVGVRAQIWVPR